MKMLAKMKGIQERMIVKLEAKNAELGDRQERMMTCLGKLEAMESLAKPKENEYSRASRGPQGRCHSETGQKVEEAA